jgi:hypothetical protein
VRDEVGIEGGAFAHDEDHLGELNDREEIADGRDISNSIQLGDNNHVGELDTESNEQWEGDLK